MKIIILSTAYPYRGGISNFTSLLFNELIKKNDVNVITFKRQYPSFLFPGKSQIEEGESPAKIPSLQKIDSINPFNWIINGIKITKQNPDLVIISYYMPFFAPCLGVIARLVKRNKKTKIISIAHNIIPHEKKTRR